MVFNLDPLDIKLEFEKRRYRLEDTIKATVTLIPNSDVELRTASLSLIAQVRRTDARAGWEMDMLGDRPYQQMRVRGDGDASAVPTHGIPVTKMSTEVCYSTSFLDSASLSSDRIGIYNAALRIGPNLPKVAQEAKDLQTDANNSLTIERWWLEVQVDVVRGRDQSVRKVIEVILT
ncbi:MAG: hypothetical protein OXK79_02665 [Chloroflexota bacterium]|nr:hypothetical protein [Chloroflexota bacterium]